MHIRKLEWQGLIFNSVLQVFSYEFLGSSMNYHWPWLLLKVTLPESSSSKSHPFLRVRQQVLPSDFQNSQPFPVMWLASLSLQISVGRKNGEQFSPVQLWLKSNPSSGHYHAVLSFLYLPGSYFRRLCTCSVWYCLLSHRILQIF